MSLDVYLLGPKKLKEHQCKECDRVHFDYDCDQYFHKNITHNLSKMADAAGIYKAIWTPAEIGITRASQLIRPLTEGLIKLLESPDEFKALNPSNGWGDYYALVTFVRGYLNACEKHPSATVVADR